jgi:hypothetical protein
MINVETQEVPVNGNLKYVRDARGRGWFCPSHARANGDFAGHGCQPAEDVVFDRGFGG